MSNGVNAAAGCLVVGEYVDEGECSADRAPGRSEVVRPQVVANSVDLWGRDNETREFTVLLRDGGIVTVRGHSLRHEPNPQQAGQEIYSIVARNGEEEVLIALFKSEDVSGIFCGEICSDRKIA